MGPLVPYFGGKNRLAKQIINRITPHTCYTEVFAGGAGVLFRKEPSRAEILNDLDREIITLYRVVKHHPQEFHRQFENVLFSRDEFNRLQQIPPETLTDVQRAAKYFYLQRSAFGGRVVGQTFGTTRTSGPKLNLFNLQQKIHKTWQRLAGVTIECLDFRDLIKKYDSSETFFFMDPPYWQLPGYRSDFEEQDFIDLAELIMEMKGKCLMTINDCPEIREIFKDFLIEEVQLKYSMSASTKSRAKTRTELFISNAGGRGI
jgi:DNA adenine methylase